MFVIQNSLGVDVRSFIGLIGCSKNSRYLGVFSYIGMAGLTVLTTRSQLIDVNMTVQLVATFTNTAGVPTNTDALPSISIVSPSGLVVVMPTTAGVMQLDVGKYQFDFLVPFNGPYGVWNDVWTGTINGALVQNSFEFVVVNTDVPRVVNSDGYVHLGDDPGFNYSQVAILNINKLLKTLKARLNSAGLSKSTDSFGNVIFVNCDIFSIDMLVSFLANALSDFNQIPFFTFFTFNDTLIIDQFHDIIVEGATLMALASQALIERGREFSITDSSINFTPPLVSEMLQTEWSTQLTQYYEKLKYIKNSMRPSPHGLGTFSVLGAGRNPAFTRLRHLRQRQLI